MANKQPPRMFTGANRPPAGTRAPKKTVEAPKNALEQAKVSPDTPLFHGTTHFFKDGEMLVPKDTVNARLRNQPLRSLYGVNVPPSVRTTDYVYTSSDVNTAKKYALQAAQGDKHMYAPVYQVQPTGDIYNLNKLLRNQDPKAQPYPQELLKTHENSYISDKPMVPQGIATWVENPDGGTVPKEFDALVSAVSAMAGGPKPTYVSRAQRARNLSEQFANINLPVINIMRQ